MRVYVHICVHVYVCIYVYRYMYIIFYIFSINCVCFDVEQRMVITLYWCIVNIANVTKTNFSDVWNYNTILTDHVS